jgi:beta-glucanase (GH16 family)
MFQMHRSLRALVFAAVSLPALSEPAGAQGWKLVWADEFEGARGSAVDARKWTEEVGGGGWGNRELQYYRAGAKNASLDGRGLLVIRAVAETLPVEFKCWYGPCRYASARLITKGKFGQTYGRFEARLRVPSGQGLWPAFWLLGEDITRVGWPACGEIDVMENIGREPSTVHGTIHGPGYSGANGLGAPYHLPDGRRFAEDFHVFGVEWEPGVIRWYVDGRHYHTLTPDKLPAGAKWVFDHPFFILLNVAVGGQWPGDPDSTTVFPQTMTVDYVRVYQRAGPRPGSRPNRPRAGRK